MKDLQKKQSIPPLALLAFAILCLVMLQLIHTNPGAERYAYAPYSFFLLQPEEVTEEAIPDYAGVRRSYTFVIPENGTTTGARVMVWLSHTFADVEIADSELASYVFCTPPAEKVLEISGFQGILHTIAFQDRLVETSRQADFAVFHAFFGEK